MSDKCVVYELVKEGDQVIGVGGSYECSKSEADKLVSAGTHKYIDVPLGEAPKPAKKQAEKPKEEPKEDDKGAE